MRTTLYYVQESGGQTMAENGQAARTLRIATARIDHVAAQGEKALNITVKSATGVGKLMAPEWRPVLAFKEGRLDWAQYTEAYQKLLRQRYAGYAQLFHDLIAEAVRNGECLVLTCYCNLDPGCNHCHRYLMAEILEKIARNEGFEVRNLGELPRRQPQRSGRQASLPLEF